MSSNTNLSYKRAVRILTGACGLLFSAFSFIYLYLFQGERFGKVTFIFPFLFIVGSADGCEPFSLSWWKLCG